MHFKGLMGDAPAAVVAGLFLTDPDFLGKTRPLFESGGLSVGAAKAIDGPESLERLQPSELGSLGVAVFDLAKHPEPLRAARELVDRCRSDTAVVILGRQNDVSLYRDLRGVGVSEYFAHPVPADELALAARRLAGLAAAGRGRRGLLIAVAGAAGGLGSGLVSAGLGAFLAELYGREAIVVDSDLGSPSAGVYLGVDAGGDLGILLEAGERLDWVLAGQAVQRPLERLALLTGQIPVDAAPPPAAEGVERLSRLLEDKYRYQIWRAGPATRGAILPICDLAVILTSGTLPCVKSTQRLLGLMAERNPSARLLVVFNHAAPSQCFTPRNLAKSLGLQIAHEIPHLKGLADDLVAGLPFTERRHRLHKSLSAIANDIMGRMAQPARKGATA
jgi:pilus assembly protein CpaE